VFVRKTYEKTPLGKLSLEGNIIFKKSNLDKGHRIGGFHCYVCQWSYVLFSSVVFWLYTSVKEEHAASIFRIAARRVGNLMANGVK
jgi:hypothetical protein